MIKSIFIGSILLLLVLTIPSLSYANGYGGNSVTYGTATAAPSILVDKLIAYPSETKGGKVEYNYVDNLSSSDYRFKPNQYIFFRIKVKNTSSKEVFNLVAVDQVPAYLKISTALPDSQFDEKTRILKFNVGGLAPEEEKVFDIQFRVALWAELPQDKGIFCIVNKVEVKNNEVADDDSSQFCIENGLFISAAPQTPAPAKIPSAGPEFGIAIVSLSSFMGYAGLKLRKFSS